mmetsp:Transcript_17409/g.12437  ORF Transcript_17409/g.12437 Transcript_17409/m.12437 type:complete len:101 (+) Transcript_17409:702-1004(+)
MYLVVINFSIMNIFTAVYFEESRRVNALEDSLKTLHKNMKHKRTFINWLKSIFFCCRNINLRKKKPKSENQEEEEPDNRGTDLLKEKQRAMRANRKKVTT